MSRRLTVGENYGESEDFVNEEPKLPRGKPMLKRPNRDPTSSRENFTPGSRRVVETYEGLRRPRVRHQGH